MPLFTVLATAAQVRLRVNASHLEPHDSWNREAGCERYIKSAVGIQQCRILSIQLQSFLVSQEHWYARAVFTVVEDLLGLVLCGIEIHVRLLENGTGPRLWIVA